MKQLYIIMACMFFAVFGFGINVQAGTDEMSIRVGSVTADTKDSITVPVTLANNPGILGATITISYDDRLTLSSISAGSALTSMVMTKPGDLKANPIKILWDGVDADFSNGEIARLTFANPGIAGTYQINVTYEEGDIIDADLASAVAIMENGSITINESKKEAAEATSEVKKAESQKKDSLRINNIVLSGISHKIAEGKKIKLDATISPKAAANSPLKWTTSDKKVATVTQSGWVTIKKNPGDKSVVIKATSKDGTNISVTWDIKVMKGAVKKIKINGFKKTLKAGRTMKLKVSVFVTKRKPVNKKLKWITSNKKYATVTKSGKVKALKAGKGKTVKITAMATDGSGKKKTVKLKIK